MNNTNLINRIEINPKIMLGKPVIKGTRIPVYVILNLLAEGQTPKEICRDYPDLKPLDIKAAVKFASLLAVFEEVPVKIEALQYA